MATKTKFEQATADNCGIGNEVRTDDGKIGVVVKMPKRGALTIRFPDGSEEKHGLTQLEVNVAKPVAMSDIPAEERKPKAEPVRQRKETIVRVVSGRTYTYLNLGRGRIDNGDAVAQMLRGKTLEEVYAIAAEELGVSVDDLKNRYGDNNVGRQRMTLGNLLRQKLKAVAAGVSYVPPFRAAEERARRQAEREAERKAKAAEKAAAKEAAKAAREAKAAEKTEKKQQRAAKSVEQQAAA